MVNVLQPYLDPSVLLKHASRHSSGGADPITPSMIGLSEITVVPIINGGTGASSASGALTALGASPLTHNHDTVYSALNHNHDTVYSALNHNHLGVYSAINHNHDTVYSPLNHTHDFSGLVPNLDSKLTASFDFSTHNLTIGDEDTYFIYDLTSLLVV